MKLVTKLKENYLYMATDEEIEEIMIVLKISGQNFLGETLNNLLYPGELSSWNSSLDRLSTIPESHKDFSPITFAFYEIGHINDHPEYLL